MPLLDAETGPMTVEQAFDMLELLGYKDDQVLVGRVQERMTPARLRVWCEECKIMEQCATTVPFICFCGGPPSNEEWYVGSLRTYVLDRVMTEESYSGNFDLIRALQREHRSLLREQQKELALGWETP